MMEEYFYYDLSQKSSRELSELYHEICSWEQSTDEVKDMKQDIKDILFRRGWID